MKKFYKIRADETSLLDTFNLMWNTKFTIDDVAVAFDSDVILSFNDLHRLFQQISLFNENCKYGNVYLREC